MPFILPLESLEENHLPLVGEKALQLGRLRRAGFAVPAGLAVTTEAYCAFLEGTGMGENILMEMNRKPFEKMRWEEIWDLSLRVRNMFLRNAMPPSLEEALTEAIDDTFGNAPVAVRSSAPGEDGAGISFAGLHDSHLNIRGTEDILDHIRQVWASLWSDRALLYRQELQLDVERSRMAVLAQKLVEGEKSGVAFSVNPTNPKQAVVEAVYGLNEGMVDGVVQPDRYVFDRESRALLRHREAERKSAMRAGHKKTRLEALDGSTTGKPPLSEQEARTVLDLVLQLEETQAAPQDMEWTFQGENLFLLQARPITTLKEDKGDSRAWYLSLHRSFDNLKNLQVHIEKQLIPAMQREADALEEQDLADFSDAELAKEIVRRSKIHDRWVEVYWKDCIPFAHGTRLFGEFYNDAIRPEDPFEFVEILSDNQMLSLARNEALAEMSRTLAQSPKAIEAVQKGQWQDLPRDLKSQMDAFAERYASFGGWNAQGDDNLADLGRLLLAMAQAGGPTQAEKRDNADKVRAFLEHFADDDKAFAEDMLSLARASYRLRDDDNLYLGRFEQAKARALAEARKRLAIKKGADKTTIDRAMTEADQYPRKKATSQTGVKDPTVRARQIVGEPAGPGVATARARVILEPSDAFAFQKGEILVCDAVEPTMTFVVPLAAGIVERRGGMLIHGAIIAREYGLPCVTGADQATGQIETGDRVTVDGYNGIVTIDRD